MSAIDLGGTMDALAVKLVSAGEKIYAYPTDAMAIPCIVIGYPTTLDFDMTFMRGGDRAIIPIWFIAGRLYEEATRNKISAIIAGATGVKDAIDGPISVALGGSCRVEDCTIEAVTVATVEYLSARFDVEVLT